MSIGMDEKANVEIAADSEKVSVAVSVIVSVTERCDDLADIYERHAAVLRDGRHRFEFIFVVDGGFEETTAALEPFLRKEEPLRIVQLPRAFGPATVLTVGFEQAKEDIIITLPSYRQTVPEGIERVMTLLGNGYDLVVARRHPRNDSSLNRFQSYVFHSLVRRLTGVDFHDLGCGLRGMSRRVLQEIQLYGDLHRFLPLLAHKKGFRVFEADIPQHPADTTLRLYRPGVYVRRILDVLTVMFLFKFTTKPLRFFGLIGSGLFVAGFVISAVLASQRLLSLTTLADRPLLILGVLLMVLGIQTGSIGLLGEMIMFTHARKMKEYTIRTFLK